MSDLYQIIAKYKADKVDAMCERISDYRKALFGIGTLMVMLTHATGINWSSYSQVLPKVCGIGSAGVDIFLFLSGIGLYYSMSKCETITKFYWHRIKRIFPAFILIGGIGYAIVDFIFKKNFITYLLQISTIAWFRYNFDGIVLWYISFILLMYLIYPLIYNILRSNNYVWKMLAVVIVDIIINILLLVFVKEVYLYYELGLSRVPIFLIGTLFGRIEYDDINTYSMNWLFIGSGIMFIITRIVNKLLFFDNIEAYDFVLRISYIFLTFIIVFLVQYLRLLKHLKYLLEVVGKYSLELYMLHMFVLAVFQQTEFYKTHDTPIYYLFVVMLLPIVIMVLGGNVMSLWKDGNMQLG